MCLLAEDASSRSAASSATIASPLSPTQSFAKRPTGFANVLAAADIGKGNCVFALLGRVPALYIAALGALKNGSVFSPLFSAFGPDPIKARIPA